jgi:hypothetical protein
VGKLGRQSISLMLCRVPLHAVNLRHGADGFTSPPKDVRAAAGPEPAAASPMGLVASTLTTGPRRAALQMRLNNRKCKLSNSNRYSNLSSYFIREYDLIFICSQITKLRHIFEGFIIFNITHRHIFKEFITFNIIFFCVLLKVHDDRVYPQFNSTPTSSNNFLEHLQKRYKVGRV